MTGAARAVWSGAVWLSSGGVAVGRLAGTLIFAVAARQHPSMRCEAGHQRGQPIPSSGSSGFITQQCCVGTIRERSVAIGAEAFGAGIAELYRFGVAGIEVGKR